MRTYLEIGTADFDTLSDRFAGRSNWRGVSVEAVPERFDRLRKHDGNVYLNAACSVDATGPADFHYIPLDAVASNQLPFLARGEGSISIEESPFLREHRDVVRTASVPQTRVTDIIGHGLFTDPITGRRRIDLLKLDAHPLNLELLGAILSEVHPTNIVFTTDRVPHERLLETEFMLMKLGYEYRGRQGHFIRYARPSVVLVGNMKWSTGSIAKDLAMLRGAWDVDCLGWDVYPRDLDLLLSEYDAVAAFTLPVPLVWPPLDKGGLLCCGPVEIDWAKNGHPFADHPRVKAPFGFLGRCIGAVSRELYGKLTREQHSKRVFYTPASARMGRFRRGEPRPIATLGWIGMPDSARTFGVDAKRYSMFEAMAAKTGLRTHVSHQNYSYDTMQRFYDQIDLLVCTSLSEGGPLGPFEAIACGVPVISTDVGLVSEVDSIPKFTDAADGSALIDRLRNDDALLASCRERQYEQLEQRFSMERLLPLWERFFEACRVANPSTLLIPG